MASFSEESLVKKLEELNKSQHSIQSLSTWIVHYRKHSKAIVEIWVKELKKSKSSRKLTLLYLANDIIQNGKKKAPEYLKEFRPALPEACRLASIELDEKGKGSLDRVLQIWEERNVYEKHFIETIRKHMAYGKSESKGPKAEETKSDQTSSQQPTQVQSKKSEAPPKKKKKVELSLKEEIEMEMGQVEPPSAEQLVKSLTDLESCASNDVVVREKIASLPPEVSDVTLLEKLSDTAEADALLKTVDEACLLLNDYNARLADELIERKKVAKMLRSYINQQKEALDSSEVKLQEYRKRLEKVEQMHSEMKFHVQSLPDFNLLPSVAKGLAPLPSAGDLFSSDKT